MAGERPNGHQYREARKRSAFFCFGLSGVLLVTDAFGLAHEVEPLVIYALFLTGAGLLGANVVGLGR